MNRSGSAATHATNLDLVRAVAVLMVVGAHLAWFHGNVRFGFFEPSLLGRLGVVIFFVHSGIEYPMIKLGNKAAAAIGRTRVPAMAQVAAACGVTG